MKFNITRIFSLYVLMPLLFNYILAFNFSLTPPPSNMYFECSTINLKQKEVIFRTFDMNLMRK